MSALCDRPFEAALTCFGRFVLRQSLKARAKGQRQCLLSQSAWKILSTPAALGFASASAPASKSFILTWVRQSQTEASPGVFYFGDTLCFRHPCPDYCPHRQAPGSHQLRVCSCHRCTYFRWPSRGPVQGSSLGHWRHRLYFEDKAWSWLLYSRR